MNAKIQLKRASALLACAAAPLLAGCSGVAEGGEVEDEVAVLEEFLNNDEDTCGTAPANATYTRVLPSPGIATPSDYSAGANGCGMAYFVDVDDYRTSNGGKYNAAGWGGTRPTSRTACEATRLMVYVFERNSDGSANFVSSKSVNGSWFSDSNWCEVPRVYFESPASAIPGAFGLTTGKNYKFAISARDTAPDPDTMKPIQLWSARPTR